MKRAARLALLLLLSALMSPLAVAASSPPVLSAAVVNELPTLVRQADVIVTAKVLGMVDPAPDAARRKAREVHRVRVQATLQGFDETGRTLLVHPRGRLLADGESYVFFLRRAQGILLENLGEHLVGASERNIELIRKEVAKRGNKVRPGRVLWMTYTGGWQREPAVEFFVDATGNFEWTSREANQRQAGTLPDLAVAGLLGQVRDAATGPIVDDAGMVSFCWVERDGEVGTRTFHSPGSGPGAELLARLADLARRYGGTSRSLP
jgi:hypothetical protein